MSSFAVSRRYAQALFDISLEGVAVGGDLEKLSMLYENVDVQDFFNVPSCSAEQKVDVAEKALACSLTPEVKRFLMLLCERSKVVLLPEIAALFAEMVRLANEELDVTALVATSLDAGAHKKLVKSVEDFVGKRVSLDVIEDASIVGGVLLKIGDRQVDCSVRGRLDSMRRALAV